MALQQEPPKIKVGIECEAAFLEESREAVPAPSGAATGASKEEGGNRRRGGWLESEATRPITRRVALQQEHPKSKVEIGCEAVLPESEAAKPRSHEAAPAPSGAATGASKEQGGNGMRSGFA
jgi:hypothetical protein